MNERSSPVSDSVMTTYGDLPADIQGHLLDLETFIGDCDGQWTALQTSDANVVLDNGTIEAGDAVKAFNGIVAALRARSSAESVTMRQVLELARDFIDPDRDPPRITNRELVSKINAALSVGAAQPSAAIASVWTPQQFWEYVEGLTDSLVRDQIRDMLASTGLTVTNVAQPSPLQKAVAAAHAAFEAIPIGYPLQQNGRTIDHTLLNEAKRLCEEAVAMTSTNATAQRPLMQIAAPGNDQLSKLWNAIVENTKGDGFWIGEILLTTLEREVGFNPAGLTVTSTPRESK